MRQACCIGPNKAGVPITDTWRRRLSRPSKRCVFFNIGRWTQLKNHSVWIVIRHRQNPSELTWPYMHNTHSFINCILLSLQITNRLAWLTFFCLHMHHYTLYYWCKPHAGDRYRKTKTQIKKHDCTGGTHARGLAPRLQCATLEDSQSSLHRCSHTALLWCHPLK
jgi:hypothetical protein